MKIMQIKEKEITRTQANQENKKNKLSRMIQMLDIKKKMNIMIQNQKLIEKKKKIL